MLSIIILAFVLVMIAVRQVGRVRFRIWQVMLCGALLSLVTGEISLLRAVKSINFDVIIFLFGMFVVGQALEQSGYLAWLSYRFFRRAKSVDVLVLLVLFGMGFMSAFLMNDTVAIIGTPVMIYLAKRHSISPKLLLLALMSSITIGSTVSPIGNPQNLLIVIHGNITNPFLSFFRHLFVPTVLNLLVAYLLLKCCNGSQFRRAPLNHEPDAILDLHLARLSQVSLLLILFMIIAKIVLAFSDISVNFRLTYISLAAALPVIMFTPRRLEIVRKIDWSTITFFVAMFVLMQSVWDSGVFQSAITRLPVDLTSTSMIFTVSVLLSQLISNVPLVALYLPMLLHAEASTETMIELAVGSTIAGNLLILGAASNIIVIQNAEKRGSAGLSFIQFAAFGLPLTVINLGIYWLCLKFL
ncbi:MAG TPA: SLC13 family permease [Syntrophales bacterium]|nr:SLC13 family permease [Syntrophales bacterium]